MDFIENRLSLRLFGEAAIEKIHKSALEILSGTGVKFESAEARAVLVKAGAKEDGQGVVRIPKEMVETALSQTRSSVTLYNIAGEAKVFLEGDNTYFDPGSSALLMLEADGLATHPAMAADLVDIVRLTEQLDALSIQSTSISPGDVPQEIVDCYRAYLLLRHGTKPMLSGAFSVPGVQHIHDLVAAATGDAALSERPRVIMDICPSPPLKWAELACHNIMDCARLGMPIEFISVPMPGACSPATLAGSVLVHTAEALSGVVLAQLVKPGAPVIYGGAPMHFDMGTMNTCLSSPEVTLMLLGYSQMGKYYGLPTHTYAALSDSKVNDSQAGAESMMGGLAAALGGVNMISGPGLLEFARIVSLEKLVIDNDICNQILRIKRGIDVSDETLAGAMIAAQGPGGDYISQSHTAKWFRKETCFLSPAWSRQSRGNWLDDGAPQMQQRAADRVKTLMAKTPARQEFAGAKALDEAMRKIMKDNGIDRLPVQPE